MLVERGAADRDHVVALVTRELQRHEAIPPQVNADTATAPASLRAVSAEPLVRARHNAGTIGRRILGPFEAWQAWTRETPTEAGRRRKAMSAFPGNAGLGTL